MADMLLTVDGDWDLSSGDAIVITETYSIRQNLDIRMQFFQGEWFLDRRLGVPWFQTILVKGTGLPLVNSILKRTILETPGVLELVSYNSTYNGANRSLSVTAQARVEGSDILLDYSKDFIL